MRRLVSVWMLAGGLLVAGGANAALTITLSESGGNVVGLATGSVNTVGATCVSGSTYGLLNATGGIAIVAAQNTVVPVVQCNVSGGPRSFGSGGGSSPSTASGDIVGVLFGTKLQLPNGYSSGANISGTATWSGNLTSLGLTAGTYTYTLPNDTVTLVISPPSPTVTSISPTSGSTAGGTPITITGTNFASPATVNIGAAACTNPTVVSATSITCTTPSGTAGTASVEVTVSGQTNAANTLFTYTAPTPPAPQPIPTLSEWAQIMMMLAMIATAGFYGWRMKQR